MNLGQIRSHLSTRDFLVMGSLCIAAFVNQVSGQTPQQPVTHQTAQASEISAPQAKDHAPLRLSLEDALKIAMTQGNKVKIADMDVQKARYDKNIALAKLFPNISATGSYDYTIKKQVMYLGGGGFKMPGMPEEMANRGIEVGRTYNVSAGIQGGLPLVNAQLWSSIKLSKQAVELALIQAEQSSADLYNQVTKAYYQALLAQESLHVLQQSYENAQKSYEDIKKKFDVGMVAEFDKIRAEVAVKNIVPSLEQARNGVEATKRQLQLLMSIDLDQPIELTEHLKDQEQNLYRSYFDSNANLASNYQLQALDKQIDILKTQEKLSLAAFLPTLNLSGYYRTMAMDDNFSWKDYQWNPTSAISLALSIPIFSGGERWNSLKKARLQTNQVMLQRDELRRGIDMQKRTYEDNMKASVEKFVAAQQSIEQAEKGYEIARKRYDVGMSTLVELNDANLALLQARLNYYEAIHDFLKNQADLNQVYGVHKYHDNNHTKQR